LKNISIEQENQNYSKVIEELNAEILEANKELSSEKEKYTDLKMKFKQLEDLIEKIKA
jgi:peptidoglycan hydrolase CwlO-like protein